MPGFFISYRRDDSAGHAGRLHDRLVENFGRENIFIDVETIGIGVDFLEAIRDAIQATDGLIAVIGREWLSATDPSGGGPNRLPLSELDEGSRHRGSRSPGSDPGAVYLPRQSRRRDLRPTTRRGV